MAEELTREHQSGAIELAIVRASDFFGTDLARPRFFIRE